MIRYAVELLPGGGGGLLVTTTLAKPLTETLPSVYVATTVPLPAAVAVKSPSWSIDPMPPVLDQAKRTSAGTPPFTTSNASNCWLCPTPRLALAGRTITE